MAGLSRLKNGVLKNAYDPAIHVFAAVEVVDARHKAGHDERKSARFQLSRYNHRFLRLKLLRFLKLLRWSPAPPR
jgi:hypothetical protein